MIRHVHAQLWDSRFVSRDLLAACVCGLAILCAIPVQARGPEASGAAFFGYLDEVQVDGRRAGPGALVIASGRVDGSVFGIGMDIPMPYLWGWDITSSSGKKRWDITYFFPHLRIYLGKKIHDTFRPYVSGGIGYWLGRSIPQAFEEEKAKVGAIWSYGGGFQWFPGIRNRSLTGKRVELGLCGEWGWMSTEYPYGPAEHTIIRVGLAMKSDRW